jgi:hypothetical protein
MSLGGIQWLATEEHFELGYWVVFARGLDPVELVLRVGAEPDPMTPLTRKEAGDLQDDTDDVVIRAGSSAGWAFGVVEGGPVGADIFGTIRALSVGTEAVELWRTVNAVMSFGYARDGETVCRFEPGLEHERSGSDPDRLLEALQRVGLVLPDGSTPFERGTTVERPELRALALAESSFGLDLPRHAVLRDALPAARLTE